MKSHATSITQAKSNPRRNGVSGTLRGYVRWLKVWLAAACGTLRPAAGEEKAPRLRKLRRRLLLTQGETQELLLAGFPGLIAVPASLFDALPDGLLHPAFPAGCGATEEAMLEAVRALERRCGLRFDWDAFLAACERRNRRTRAALAFLESLNLRIPPLIDTGSARAAMDSLARSVPSDRNA